MNTRHLITVGMALLLLMAALPTLAGDIKDDPGYIDLSWIEIPDDADEIQDIDLTSMLDDLADDARKDGEDDLADLIGMVRSVRVKWFSLDEDDGHIKKAVDRMTKKLSGDGWTRLFYLKDGDETISVNTQSNRDGDMVGLTVMVYEPGEEVGFVNVVGDLDLARLLSMAGEFDLDDIDELIEAHEGHEDHVLEVH